MNGSRFWTITAALVSTAFQMVTEAHATPAPSANPPWLDGRPTVERVASGPTWRPGGVGVVRFIRFDAGLGPTYGILEDDAVHAIAGTPFAPLAPTGWVHRISATRVLAPLGPDEFAGARWVGAGGGRLLRGRSVSAADLWDPGTELPLTAAGRVWPVLGVVVGGSAGAPALFGVTAGFLGVDPTSAPLLVLGPSIASGVDMGSLRVESGVAGPGGRLTQLDPHGEAGLSQAHALIAAGASSPGEVLLIPIHGGLPAEADRPRTLYNHISGVGRLQCSLRRVVGDG